MMDRFAFTRPSTLAQAAEGASSTVADAMAAAGDATRGAPVAVVKAGGIDLLDLLKEGLLSPATVVSLSGIPGLAAIDEADGGMRIGALVTLDMLAGHPALRRRYPILCEAAGASASPQIRHVATLGGNLLQRPRCWYFRASEYRCLRKGGAHCFAMAGENQYHAIFDNGACAVVHPSTAATALVALGASVELVNAAGARRRLLVEDFLVSPGTDPHRENDLKAHEILAAVILPPLAGHPRMAQLKQGEKDSFDWPLADVAVVLDIDGEGICRAAAVVLGAAAPVPHRARAAEAALVGQRIGDGVARTAARAALEGATPLSGNAYKLPLFETLVRRALLMAVAPQSQRNQEHR